MRGVSEVPQLADGVDVNQRPERYAWSRVQTTRATLRELVGADLRYQQFWHRLCGRERIEFEKKAEEEFLCKRP